MSGTAPAKRTYSAGPNAPRMRPGRPNFRWAANSLAAAHPPVVGSSPHPPYLTEASVALPSTLA
jgi:hypothetical protein